MKRASLWIAVLLAAMSVTTPAQNPSPIFIHNATVLTVTHGNIEHGSILIRDGKIAAGGERDFEGAGRRDGDRCDRPVRNAWDHRLPLTYRHRWQRK